MTSKNSITDDEKKLLEYVYEKANDIIDYCRRNNVSLPVSLSIEHDYIIDCKAFDYRRVSFSERYLSGRPKRIVSLSYNPYSDKAEYDEFTYEDKDDECIFSTDQTASNHHWQLR